MPVPRIPICYFTSFLLFGCFPSTSSGSEVPHGAIRSLSLRCPEPVEGSKPFGSCLLAAIALQVVHGVDRYVVLVHEASFVHQLSAFWVSPPKPKPFRAEALTAGSAAGTAETADASAGVTGFAAPNPRLAPALISSALFTFTVDCSAWCRGFMCR